MNIASRPLRQSWLRSVSFRRVPPVFWLCLVVHWLGLSSAAAEWQGFARTPVSLDGHSGFVTRPKEAAPGRPWIWRTSFPDYHREVDLALLRRGFHVGYLNVVNLLGSDAALDSMDRFHYRVTKQFGLAERPALYAVSRGGLHAYRYAARRPERIACLYADVPVMSLASWPLGAGATQPLQDALRHYGFADESALQRFKGNPIDLLEPIAKARLPLRHILSLNDRVVPPEQNTLEAQRRLRALGHDLEIVTIAEGTAKSKGHQFPDTEVDQTVEWIVRHASPVSPTQPRSGPQVGPTPSLAARPTWAFTPDPQLPNVLLLGDSISIGYTLAVRELLAGRANVYLNQLRHLRFNYIVDESPLRCGKFIPQTETPIVAPAEMIQHPPVACLVTAWNHRDDIVRKYPGHSWEWLTAFGEA